ncbi:MAG: asparagine synthase (glutamine-hydrolyzing) [archaeon]|nr:asparagine synthase (glutamine-hydrolyzing) [archaeon]
MCGICGVIGLEDKVLVKKMADAIEHRGPNNKGYLVENNASFGYRRLTIIDTKERTQPIIHNEDESIWILFNGEVYNYRELKKKLEGKHKFYTDTDTETIVHLYEEMGEDFVKELRGMYCFALYDSTKNKTILVRDRLGIKPLYYSMQNNKLFFGSEIKSILQSDEIKRTPNLKVLPHYLAYRYVPGAATMFEGIFRLLPGEMLIIDHKNPSKPVRKKYWDMKAQQQNLSFEQTQKELLEMLDYITEIHLLSDVPLGVFLSGGVDSSAIVALMKKQVDSPIKTFSIGFKEDPVNEFNYAKKVSEFFETEHHEFLEDEKSISVLPEIIYHLDEPIADAVVVSKYLLSKHTQKHVTVVLTGEGGDEIFGGYVHYKSLNTLNNFTKLPKTINKNIIANMISLLPVSFFDKFFDYPYSIGEKGKQRLIDYFKQPRNEAGNYLKFISLFDEKDLNEILKNDFKKKIDYDLVDELQKIYFNNNNQSFLHKIFVREMHSWLPDYILLQQDKITMAASLEARVPFLDHKLAEFCLNWPNAFKSNGKEDKFLFRKAMKPLLPEGIASRKKFPFFIPIDSWFEKSIKERAQNILDEKQISKRGYFNNSFVQKILREHDKSKLIYSRQIWGLMTLELWHQIFIDEEKIKMPTKSF